MPGDIVDLGISQLTFGHPSMLFVLAIAFNLIVCNEKFHNRCCCKVRCLSSYRDSSIYHCTICRVCNRN